MTQYQARKSHVAFIYTVHTYVPWATMMNDAWRVDGSSQDHMLMLSYRAIVPSR